MTGGEEESLAPAVTLPELPCPVLAAGLRVEYPLFLLHAASESLKLFGDCGLGLAATLSPGEEGGIGGRPPPRASPSLSDRKTSKSSSPASPSLYRKLSVEQSEPRDDIIAAKRDACPRLESQAAR